MDDLTMEHPDLEEFFDAGEALPPTVREHVAGCRSCAAELAALTGLRRQARALPREIEPARDLWSGIAARIATEPGAAGPASAAVVPLRRRERTHWQQARGGWLAAAAVVLVVISSGVTTILIRGGAGPMVPVAANQDAGAANPVGLAAFAAAEPEYRMTVEALEAELAARRDALSPATVQIVEQNLLIIDNAIEEARRALAADPTSADLPLLLSGVYRQKVELLRQAVELTARS